MLLVRIVFCISSVLNFHTGIIAQVLHIENPIRFLALGDSYTIGQGVSPDERWPVQLLDSLATRGIETDTLRIIATTGWRTDNLINAIKGQNLQEQNYNLVSLLIGVNNQYQNRPVSQYINEFPALLDSAIRYAGGDASHVFVVSIPDYAYTPFGQNLDPAEISMEIDQYNAINQQITDSMGVTYFNITPISRLGLSLPQYVANDGLHPSGEQYTEWVKLMLEVIDEQLTSVEHEVTMDDINLVVSPNPATSTLKIEISGHANAVSHIIICALDGRKVFEEEVQGHSCEISISAFPVGVYIIKAMSGGSEVIHKFVKQ